MQRTPGPRQDQDGPSVASVVTVTERPVTVATALFTVLAALAQAWALICVGRGLGTLATPPVSGATDLWQPYALEAFLSIIGSACSAGLSHALAQASAADAEGVLRRRLVACLFSLAPGQVVDARSGATVSMLTDGAQRVAAYRHTFLAPTLAAVLSPLAVLFLVGCSIDWVPALILAVLMVAVPGGIAVAYRRLRASSARSRGARMRLAADYLDALQGLTTLVLARAAQRQGAQLRARGQEHRRALMRLLAGNQLVILLTDGLFSLLLLTLAAALAMWRVRAGVLPISDGVALVLVSLVLLEPLDRVGSFFYVGMGGRANQRMMRRLFAQVPPLAPEENAPADPLPGAPADAAGAPCVCLHAVSARWPAALRVGVGHPGGQGHPGGPASRLGGTQHSGGVDGAGHPGSGHLGPRPSGAHAGPVVSTHPGASQSSAHPGTHAQASRPTVLTDLTLTVDTGAHLAVVGPSGSGKSTLLALLSGDLLPSTGTVAINGLVSTPATLPRIRAASVLVAQHAWLMTGTIADNLRLADPTASPARMWEALTDANLADDVATMPGGLNAPVGEQGMSISGGQAQRLALARAFLANRPLLLLDEPTSDVDLASEAHIMDAIERLARTRTVITVSHRAGALVACDQILTLDEVSAP